MISEILKQFAQIVKLHMFQYHLKNCIDRIKQEIRTEALENENQKALYPIKNFANPTDVEWTEEEVSAFI